MNTYQTETREIGGVSYRVEWHYDHDIGAPQNESDGHGVVVELGYDPEEDPELDIEEVVRHKMMRRLSSPDHRHTRGVEYYDVWETLKIAKHDGWGVANPTGLSPEEVTMAAIEEDFNYLRGWYNDDWHWCGITVIALDEDGEDTAQEESLCGISSDDGEYHEEVIRDLVQQIKYHVRQAANVLQIPLPFEPTTT